MTKKQFMFEIKRRLADYARRVARLQAVQRGDATIVRVYRRGYVVREHRVKPHYMTVVRLKRDAETTRTRRAP